MKFVVQRVISSQVDIGSDTVGKIGGGFMVLVGICGDDDARTADKMVRKLCAMRIFEDEAGKTNLALADVGGSLLLVPQFTLYADCKKGNRPSFIKAGNPEHASALFDYIVSEARKYVPDVQAGVFGAYMKVSLINDGPFTIVLDSDEL